ncbi:MAG: ATP-binding protein [Pseudomonadota bacterium]
MGFNLRVLLHVGGLLLTLSALAWCLTHPGYYATLFTLSLLLMAQVTGLIRHINHTNHELARFLGAVQHGDFSQSFRNISGYAGFQNLGSAFDGVLERLRNERSDKEVQATYLQAFVQQLPIGVFCLHEDGHITLANLACLRLLGLKELNHARQLTIISEKFAAALSLLEPGQEQSLQIQRLSTGLDLRLSCTVLRSKGQQHKLVSLLDIRSALESRELEAWHNLIRVMTHEIMNSITPLTSLADTASRYISEARNELAQTDNAAPTTLGLLEDAGSATTTIGKRGAGLMRFVDSYRTLTRLPPPQPRMFDVASLLHSVQELLQEQAREVGIKLLCTCQPTNLTLHADADLLEQALINLIRNAFDAVAGVASPRVTLSAKLVEGGVVIIDVQDNGCGIAPDIIDSIFIPFFTTKRGGSGIGLSLVKQIVQLNGGRIAVTSAPAAGTCFTLTFN